MVPDFIDVKGQEGVRRAFEIAAAGGHNILLVGPPGSGKSMMAKRLPGILPDMSREEILQTTEIHSVAGLTDREHPLVRTRPFRSPHHSISTAGLAGGGVRPFKNFPQFVVIYTVKGFGIVNKGEVDIFLALCSFS